MMESIAKIQKLVLVFILCLSMAHYAGASAPILNKPTICQTVKGAANLKSGIADLVASSGACSAFTDCKAIPVSSHIVPSSELKSQGIWGVITSFERKGIEDFRWAYARGLHKEQAKVMKVCGIKSDEDYAKLSSAAWGIFQEESKSGESFWYHFKALTPDWALIGAKCAKEMKKRKGMPSAKCLRLSYGPTQVKEIPDEIKRTFGFSETDLWTKPDMAAVATICHLADDMRHTGAADSLCAKNKFLCAAHMYVNGNAEIKDDKAMKKIFDADAGYVANVRRTMDETSISVCVNDESLSSRASPSFWGKGNEGGFFHDSVDSSQEDDEVSPPKHPYKERSPPNFVPLESVPAV